MEFFNKNLTKDLSLLLHAIHSPFFFCCEHTDGWQGQGQVGLFLTWRISGAVEGVEVPGLRGPRGSQRPQQGRHAERRQLQVSQGLLGCTFVFWEVAWFLGLDIERLSDFLHRWFLSSWTYFVLKLSGLCCNVLSFSFLDSASMYLLVLSSFVGMVTICSGSGSLFLGPALMFYQKMSSRMTYRAKEIRRVWTLDQL